MPKAPSTLVLKQVAKMASSTATATASSSSSSSATVASFTKPPRQRKPPPESTPEVIPEYFFEHGLRHIKPYHQTHLAHVKGRWIGKTIPSVFAAEMPRRCSESMVDIVDRLVTAAWFDSEYFSLQVLTFPPFLTNPHRIEPAVPDTEIKIIERADDYLVFDKPHGITVHPNELCQFNSALEILRRHHNIPKSFHPVNRLDGVTSGIVILANTADALIRARFQSKEDDESPSKGVATTAATKTASAFSKEYLCRVVGEFPTTPVTCREPIYQSAGKMSVDPRGKPSETRLERVWYDASSDSSLVRCFLSTGRQHQIRLHTAYLNHPIVNDILYNRSLASGNESNNDNSSSTRFYPPNIPPEQQPYMPLYPDKSTPCFKCAEEQDPSHPIPDTSKMKIWLRAIRYTGPDWAFEADMPDWADPSVVK
ncbi:RNA pseudouridylate synthase domain containing protein 2 [Actinomortierella ambigua]|uniref:RNA pseudouridylate synthase domain containing protein 2 n=1 Tax=Actinomortierella ambigua TaxID=1343610 RepID=A0A9P6PZB3_9FUNG|nr:RNA pseudouridylate synthase domain containing protein 2 [Actinomortierella ambigua]